MNQREQTQKLKMIITEPIKTETDLMFFFDFRIRITPFLQTLHVKLLL